MNRGTEGMDASREKMLWQPFWTLGNGNAFTLSLGIAECTTIDKKRSLFIKNEILHKNYYIIDIQGLD